MSYVPLHDFNIAFHDFTVKVNTLSIKPTCQKLILNESKSQREGIGLLKCLRWSAESHTRDAHVLGNNLISRGYILL